MKKYEKRQISSDEVIWRQMTSLGQSLFFRCNKISTKNIKNLTKKI